MRLEMSPNPTSTPKTILVLLRKKIQDSGWLQQDIARIAHVDVSSISRICRTGEEAYLPNFSTVIAILVALTQLNKPQEEQLASWYEHCFSELEEICQLYAAAKHCSKRRHLIEHRKAVKLLETSKLYGQKNLPLAETSRLTSQSSQEK